MSFYPNAAPAPAEEPSYGSKVHHGVVVASSALLIVGGLNWGSIALKKGDFVEKLFRNQKFPILPRAVKGLVGVAAVYVLIGIIVEILHRRKVKDAAASA